MKIRELLESMDGVSQGTHMFTGEETRGTAKTFGAEALAGIKNKERILKAASFVTRQANHPQNQAKLVRRNSSMPNGYQEVVTLSTADTKLWAKKLQDFFRNPANNTKHRELYRLLSDPTDPEKIKGLVSLLASMNRPVTEKWSEKYKRSINCSNPRGFSQRAHCQGRKKSSSKKPVGEAAVGSITVGPLEVLIDEHALDRARERGIDPVAVDYIIKKQMPEVLSKLSQLASGEKVWVYDWSRETALGLRRISSSELKFVLKTVWPGKPAQTPTVTKIIRT
jgi:hypothetical protein